MNQREKTKYLNEHIFEMYDFYLQGNSMQKVGEKYGFGRRTIEANFKKHGLQSRSNKINSRKYSINHDFFENIDNERNAYWLGFMYADGFLSNPEGSKKVGMSLAIEDKHHIEKFARDIESTYHIKEYVSHSTYGSNPYAKLIVTSDKMFEDLESHGCIQHKTKVIKPPVLMSRDLERHFIRGYFDGDGSLKKCNGNYGYEFGFHVVGTDELLTFISEHLMKNGLVNRITKLEKRRKYQDVSSIRYGGNTQVYNIMSYLYNKSTIYLDRKYERYLELQELHNCRIC
jgi:DNA-binding transcriptional regulator WhiA